MESQKSKSVIKNTNCDGISEKWDFYAILLSEIEIPIIDIEIKLRGAMGKVEDLLLLVKGAF